MWNSPNMCLLVVFSVIQLSRVNELLILKTKQKKETCDKPQKNKTKQNKETESAVKVPGN